MPITYDSQNNIITVTGYTQTSPCTFEDVYQADVSNGWGVVSKQGKQYHFDARLQIGDGTTETWFVDTRVQVYFSNLVGASYAFVMEIKSQGNIRFGTLVDEAKKVSKDGVSILLYEYPPAPLLYMMRIRSGATAEFYASFFQGGYSWAMITIDLTMADQDARFWECVLDKCYPYKASVSDFYRCEIRNSRYGLRTMGGTFEDLLLHSQTENVIMYEFGQGGDLKNVVVKNQPASYYLFRCYYMSVNHNVINMTAETWNFSWLSSTGKIYRQYEFDLKVTDKNGNTLPDATVTLLDKNGTQVFQLTTDANGKITTQTVSRGWYEQATGDTLNDLSPHTLKIEKAGYQTYEKKFILEEKTSWEIKLAKAVGVFLDFGRPIINLKKSDPENKNVMVL